MAKNLNPERDDVLFSKEKFSEGGTNEKKGNEHSPQGNKSFKCYRCGKPGHIKRNCRVKLSKAHIACDEEEDDQPNWEQCFTIEVIEGRDNNAQKSASHEIAANYAKVEWIIDSSCSHHITGNDSLFSELRQHNRERVVVTADNSTHPLSLRKHLIFFPNSFSTAFLNSTNMDSASLFSFKNFTQVYLE